VKPPHTQPKQRLGNPILQERIHDPYKSSKKLHEPTRCPQCRAVFSDGRWRWTKADNADETLCPACHRMNDRYPAGEVILTGGFLAAHADEVLGLVRNTEQAERQEHPLNRIMDIQQREHDVLITTTDIHLPRRIGHALEDAWKGELSTHYDEEGYFARVTWRRDE
jgi:hypothetical protein